MKGKFFHFWNFSMLLFSPFYQYQIIE